MKDAVLIVLTEQTYSKRGLMEWWGECWAEDKPATCPITHTVIRTIADRKTVRNLLVCKQVQDCMESQEFSEHASDLESVAETMSVSVIGGNLAEPLESEHASRRTNIHQDDNNRPALNNVQASLPRMTSTPISFNYVQHDDFPSNPAECALFSTSDAEETSDTVSIGEASFQSTEVTIGYIQHGSNTRKQQLEVRSQNNLNTHRANDSDVDVTQTPCRPPKMDTLTSSRAPKTKVEAQIMPRFNESENVLQEKNSDTDTRSVSELQLMELEHCIQSNQDSAEVAPLTPAQQVRFYYIALMFHFMFKGFKYSYLNMKNVNKA